MFVQGKPYNRQTVQDAIAEASTRQCATRLKGAFWQNQQLETPLSNREMIQASGCPKKLRAFDAIVYIGYESLLYLRCGRFVMPNTQGVVEFLLLHDCTTFRARFAGKAIETLAYNGKRMGVATQLSFLVSDTNNAVTWDANAEAVQDLVTGLDAILNKPIVSLPYYRPF